MTYDLTIRQRNVEKRSYQRSMIIFPFLYRDDGEKEILTKNLNINKDINTHVHPSSPVLHGNVSIKANYRRNGGETEVAR